MGHTVPHKQCNHLLQPLAGLAMLSLMLVMAPCTATAQVNSRPTSASVNSNTDATNAVEFNDAYTLAPGDRIRIDVFKVTQYSGENQVLVDGTLNLPQVGYVSVQGLTLKEAAQAVSAQYASILRYPFVTVSLLAPAAVKVGIAGEVNRPGSYTIPSSDGGSQSSSQLPTVTRAIQLAGGITQIADLRKVEVRRSLRSGDSRVIKVDLWDFLQTGNLRRDITLRSGDSIYIPTVTQTNLAESVQLSAASFAADKSVPLNIAIVGEVYRPGPYTVTASAKTGAAGETGQSGGGGGERPPTITRAIQVAGGIKPQADVRRIQVRRLARNGAEQIISINLWQLLQSGDLSQDLILQDRDTVVIPTATALSAAESTQIAAASFSPDSIRVNVVGEVKQPGVVKVPPNTPLNQALLAAGGFNIRARQKNVDLIRLNTDGTVTRRTIAVDFARGLDEQGNPALRNDDIVVVNRSALTVFSDNLGSVLNPVNGFLSVFSIFRIFTQ
ncbi:MAG: SLBB domain-containing protein [Lyngbya sp. HA4199-MV5]|nr:SLBB domain-containing protein [Lyngbya sp. HA4199-MV5]